MTRPFNQQFHCPNCKTWHSAETLFGRWIRNNPSLDSKSGYVVTDQDYWIHRYKTDHGREFQLIMLCEIKTMGADLTIAQTDTLHIVNQLMRNRKQTPTKELRHQAGTTPRISVFSAMQGHHVNVRAYGMHVLTFSGLGPDDSEWIRWDKQEVNLETLTGLLRFDLDPDTLKPLDLRVHHRTARTQVLPLNFGDVANG